MVKRSLKKKFGSHKQSGHRRKMLPWTSIKGGFINNDQDFRNKPREFAIPYSTDSRTNLVQSGHRRSSLPWSPQLLDDVSTYKYPYKNHNYLMHPKTNSEISHKVSFNEMSLKPLFKKQKTSHHEIHHKSSNKTKNYLTDAEVKKYKRSKIEAGDYIVIKWSKDRWYLGTVLEMFSNHKFRVGYDDGTFATENTGSDSFDFKTVSSMAPENDLIFEDNDIIYRITTDTNGRILVIKD